MSDYVAGMLGHIRKEKGMVTGVTFRTTITIEIDHDEAGDTEGLDEVVMNITRKWDFPYPVGVTISKPIQHFEIGIPDEWTLG